MAFKIAMIGAGSFFTDGITDGLCEAGEIFDGSTFVLVDIDDKRLSLALDRNRAILGRRGGKITLKATTDRRRALEGCDFVVTSCEKLRARYWKDDLAIPARFGVDQYLGENGGPGGQAHAMRNITMFMDICRDMREQCPQAWLMNFTNPMSFLCTYFHRYGGVRALGFCHQVHGSIGVVSEMLGFEPGELEVITAGINHFNWLLDIRRRGTGRSFMPEFRELVLKSRYWRKVRPRTPAQVFTRDIFETFGVYPIGYDDHICEYLPFFYNAEERERLGYESKLGSLQKELKTSPRWRKGASAKALKVQETRARQEFHNVPFPRDGNHPYYRERPTSFMEALATNRTLYVDSIVIPNRGAVSNLPDDALVDIPAIAVGGDVRGVTVGPLPLFAMELCRRQITIHELLTEATVTGDRQKVVQSLALDPYVRGIGQARRIADAFLKHYREELPQFSK